MNMEMMNEMGFCSGIENYSRHLDIVQRAVSLIHIIDYFPKDFLIIVDESHVQFLR